MDTNTTAPHLWNKSQKIGGWSAQFLRWQEASWTILSHTRKEGNVLFNDTLNTFYLRLYGVTHMVEDHSDSEREETRCRHMGYSFRLAARVLLYASSHRQDNTYHCLCYTSRGTLAGTRNSSMGPPWRIDPTTHRVMSERSYHGATSRSPHTNNVKLIFITTDLSTYLI